MTQKNIKTELADIFVPRDNGEGVAFKSEAMRTTSELYPIYKAISKAMRDSGLSFDFSYEVANKAVDILAENDWNNEDAINDGIDSAIPVYTHELMSIYTSDSWQVDEAVAELGGGDSNRNAISGWYMAIDNMVQQIKTNLE